MIAITGGTGFAVKISGVTVTGGTLKGTAGGSGGAAGQDANGGGIDNGSMLTLTDVTVTGNTATGGRGGNNAAGVGGNGGQAVGGIYNYQQLTLTDCTVSNNVATSGGGGNGSGGNGGSSGHAVGGIVSNAGETTTVTNSTITGNQATSGDGGTSDTSGKVAGAGGSVVGGFEDNFASLTMTGTTVSHNSGIVGVGGAGTGGAQGGGSFNAVGGFAVNVAATISDDTISSNTASGGNAGSPSQTGGGISGAGAYFGPPTGASQTITGTTITDNAGYGGLGTGGDAAGSVSGGGAIAVPAANATVAFSSDTLSGNTLHSGPVGTNPGGSATGAGLFVNSPAAGTVSLSGVTITGNSAAGVGSYGTAHGGGIAVAASVSPLTISGSAITGNSATGASVSTGGGTGGGAEGGGIWTEAPLQVSGDTVADNTAAGGSSSGSAYPGNASGGGLYSTTGEPLAIRNSTFAGNAARAGTPSVAQYSADATGGGIDQSASGPLTLAADTLEGNVASAPSGFSAGGNVDVDLDAVLEDTIIADGSAGSPDTANCAGDLGIVDDGFNLESSAPSQCGLHASSDLIGVDPMLGPLASNGGPTQTMALGGTSPALAAGGACDDPSNSNAPLKIDQRAEPRHVQCDIGAFEHQSPAITKAPTISGAPGAGETLSCNAAGTFSGDPTLALAYQWLRGGKPISNATGAKYKVQNGDNGQRLSCRVTASNAYGSASGTSKTVTGVAKPTLSKVSESNKRWRESSKSARLARATKAPVGTSFEFTLNVSASVELTFAAKHHKAAGMLTFKSARAGKRKVAFAGRLSKSEKLTPGSYQVKIVATNSAGQRSGAKTLSFTIVR